MPAVGFGFFTVPEPNAVMKDVNLELSFGGVAHARSFPFRLGCWSAHLSARIDAHCAFNFVGLRPLLDVAGGTLGAGSSR